MTDQVRIDELIEFAKTTGRIEELNGAADVIMDRFMPMCVCEVHGGHDVADTVKRICRTLIERADRLSEEVGYERP